MNEKPTGIEIVRDLFGKAIRAHLLDLGWQVQTTYDHATGCPLYDETNR